MQDITDNKKFWKTIRPYFSDKGYNQTKITIVENDTIITDEKEIATLMNNNFINITKNLHLKPSTVSNASGINEITKHFDDHISVCKKRRPKVKFYEKMISFLKWFPWTKSRK